MARIDTVLLSHLASSCDTEGDYLRAIIRLKGETNASLGRKMGTTGEYVSMCVNNKSSIGIKARLKFARALDIDPYAFNRGFADHEMKKLIESESKLPTK